MRTSTSDNRPGPLARSSCRSLSVLFASTLSDHPQQNQRRDQSVVPAPWLSVGHLFTSEYPDPAVGSPPVLLLCCTSSTTIIIECFFSSTTNVHRYLPSIDGRTVLQKHSRDHTTGRTVIHARCSVSKTNSHLVSSQGNSFSKENSPLTFPSNFFQICTLRDLLPTLQESLRSSPQSQHEYRVTLAVVRVEHLGPICKDRVVSFCGLCLDHSHFTPRSRLGHRQWRTHLDQRLDPHLGWVPGHNGHSPRYYSVYPADHLDVRAQGKNLWDTGHIMDLEIRQQK